MARFALAIIMLASLVAPLTAQEALPETPPELRDFRLDPERQPAPEPQVQPPPIAPTVEPETRTEPTPAPASRPAQRRAEPAPPTRREDNADEMVPTPAPVVEPETDITEPVPVIAEPDAEPAPVATAPAEIPWWQIALGLAATLAALIGAWLFLQQRRPVREERVSLVVPESVAPVPTPVAPPKPVMPPMPATVAINTRRPRIAVEFIPERATLGFSALTLKGQLRLVNEGDAPAQDMQLRATMISANQRQNEVIAAFQGGAIPIQPNALGDAKAGERMALDMEMSVQIDELESYTVGERKIFVPVMLANISYGWDGGQDEVTMACMVGRETEPAQAKMGPLRLDLGPRSFAPLGQRPIYA
jgi:hypothetical protein